MQKYGTQVFLTMQLVFSLRGRSVCCAWSAFALFRDNVQHFLEQGRLSERFAALHGIERAVNVGNHAIEAVRLRSEIHDALDGLARVRLQEAAISLRTRAILTGSARQPAVRGTVSANQAGWRLPEDGDPEANLLESARSFLEAVLAVTSDAVDGDALSVSRVGTAPRFAATR